MRTTVTLDEDVALTVQEEMRKGEGKTFKEAVNGLIRKARYAEEANPMSRKPFKLKGRMLKSRENVNFDCISKLLEDLDGGYLR